MKLQSPIKFTKFVRPICLPLQKYSRRKLVSFRHCVLSGFGRTNKTGIETIFLKKLNIKLHITRNNIFYQNYMLRNSLIFMQFLEGTKPKYLQQGRMNILSNNDCGPYLDPKSIYYPQHGSHKHILERAHLICAGSIPLELGINACLVGYHSMLYQSFYLLKLFIFRFSG